MTDFLAADHDFFSAEQLGLTERYRESLIWTLRQLEHNFPDVDPSRSKAPMFNMDIVLLKGKRACPFDFKRKTYDCGTVGCIAGWAAVHHYELDPFRMDEADEDRAFAFFSDAMGPLYDLYWASPTDKDSYGGMPFGMDAITAKQAGTALRNFLTTGEPRWEEVVDPDKAAERREKMEAC